MLTADGVAVTTAVEVVPLLVDCSLENSNLLAAAAVGGVAVDWQLLAIVDSCWQLLTRMVRGVEVVVDDGGRKFCFRRLWGCLGWKERERSVTFNFSIRCRKLR